MPAACEGAYVWQMWRRAFATSHDRWLMGRDTLAGLGTLLLAVEMPIGLLSRFTIWHERSLARQRGYVSHGGKPFVGTSRIFWRMALAVGALGLLSLAAAGIWALLGL